MGLFGDTLKKLSNKYSGKTDFLEAAVAAGIIAAAANGISDDEVATLTDTICGMESLTANFTTSQIEEVCERYIKRAKTAVGRAGLQRELDDIAKFDIQMREDVFLVAFEVAASEDGVDQKERDALNKIAGRLGVDANKLMAV